MTRILTVVHDNGDTAYCDRHPGAILQEVAEGPHQGKRGCDGCLYDLVGPITLDRAEVVSYETGKRRPACVICGRLPPVICVDCMEAGGDLSLTDILNLAADKIAECDTPSRWDSWLYILFDVLEGKTDPESYEGFLGYLRNDIMHRLESGGW